MQNNIKTPKHLPIGSSNDPTAVKAQYATAKGLNTRISFHDKYSTNKQGLSSWLISHYDIREGMRVLDIGCGNGGLWLGHDDLVSRCKKLILADPSEGMLETAQSNLGKKENMDYQLADIQDLPFEDDSFDVVIANFMLYHVPDLEKALQEVRRVLKTGGTFYCATMGERNFTDQLATWFKLGGEDFHPNHNFTLQNGKENLEKVFTDISSITYEDSLHITDIDDLVDYLRSLASFKAIMDLPVEKLRSILSDHVIAGAIDLPKEYGTFICK